MFSGVKERCNKETRRTFFKNRTIPFWNNLPNKVIEAPNTKSFEKRLDKFWSQFKIKFDFEKRKSDPNYAGIRNRKTWDADLEIQAD